MRKAFELCENYDNSVEKNLNNHIQLVHKNPEKVDTHTHTIHSISCAIRYQVLHA